MTSIRIKLLFSFLAIIGILVLLDLALVVTHSSIVKRYERVDNNIFLQFQLIGTTNSLIKAYNNYRNVPTPEYLQEYRTLRAGLDGVFTSLEKDVVNQESRNALFGVENTIRNLVEELESGIRKIDEGDIVNTAVHYSEANRKFTFVRENTASLILKELEYAQVLQTETKKINTSALQIGSILLGTIVVGCLLLSLILSRSLVLPLAKLTVLAKIIAAGDLNAKVDQGLLDAQDEVGSLANSFNTMIGSLRKTIASLEESNRQTMESNRLALEAKEALQVKNDELGRLNKVFVDRELKMIELKSRIKALEEPSAK
jgi:nitrogen fixation/metabolism regulation signal transduction histidine kinase